MANYQLGPVIGKVGGAEVQKIPVDIVADGGSSSEVIMHTVHVPEGESWLVALIGDISPSSSIPANFPEFSIGEVASFDRLEGRGYLAAEVTGTAEITLKRNTNSGSDRFSGHIYVAPLPA